MQQSPNQRTHMFEFDLVRDRIAVLNRAYNALISASDATVHVTPDPTHFTPVTTKEMLFAKQLSQEQALHEYSENVNRNLFEQASAASDAQTSDAATTPIADTSYQAQTLQAARQQIDKAHQNDFPLPQELIDA